MASSSFYSGTGVTADNPDVDPVDPVNSPLLTPVAPSNINAIEDSKNAAQASAEAAAASEIAAEGHKNAILGNAPSQLGTLEKLAAAINNDADFFNTIKPIAYSASLNDIESGSLSVGNVSGGTY